MKPRLTVLSLVVSLSIATLIGLTPTQASSQPDVRSAIVFSSTRDTPDRSSSELYLMLTGPGGAPAQTRRLTQNASKEGFADLSPDGTRIVFDSDRLTFPLIHNSFWSDLYVMPVHDNDEHPVPDDKQKHLTRGSSASWSPDGKRIVFHASQSGVGQPEKDIVGAETTDSDIFVLNVDECLKVNQIYQVDDCRQVPGPHVMNITNNGNLTIDDDPDWSSDGTKIVYVRHAPTTNRQSSPDAEIYMMRVNPEGMPVQDPQQLTFNQVEEERGPSWSPDSRHIAYACKSNVFRICVMDTDHPIENHTTVTSGPAQLTPTWSPDGTQIVFHGRQTTPPPPPSPPIPNQLFTLTLSFEPDGSVGSVSPITQLTGPPGDNIIASWGKVRD